MNFRTFALSNIRGNWQRYTAYYLSSSFAVTIYFIFALFIFHPDIANGGVADHIRKQLIFCEVIIIIFSFFFVLYSNSAFLKSRKKEFGLLFLFGMTKRQVHRLVLYENTVISLLAIGSGLLAGMLLSKLFFMAIGLLLGVSAPLPFVIAPQAVFVTFVSFFILFELLTAVSLFQVGKSEIVELFQAAKKPKTLPAYSVWLGMMAVVCLAAGYYLAWNRGDQIVMTPILILVLIGTYYFFTQSSIAVLQKLTRLPAVYYKRTNLLVISQLVFRLKDNARTFYAVTVLAAVVLTASGAFYIYYQGMKDSTVLRYPHTFSIVESGQVPPNESVSRTVEPFLSEQRFRIADQDKVSGWLVSVEGEDQPLFLIPAAHYNERANKMARVDPLMLEKNEAIIVTPYPELEKIEQKKAVDLNVSIGEQTFSLNVGERRHIPVLNQRDASVVPSLSSMELLVVNDDDYEAMRPFVANNKMITYYGYELSNWENSEQAIQQLKKTLPQNVILSSRVGNYLQKKEGAALLLFIGLFISLLFFIAAGSFLYFKLFTELQEDHDLYKALARIGVSAREMNKIATTQISLMFFLPFLIGALHASFALKVLGNILGIDVWYYGTVVFGIYFVMQLVYFMLSRRTYLRQMTHI